MITRIYNEKIASIKSMDYITNMIQIDKQSQIKIEEYEKLFETIEFYDRSEISLFSKYYIVNKKKHNSENIQEYVQHKIRELNRINNLNKYFFQLNKEIVDKDENIHNYNNYNISVVQFQHMTLKQIIDDSILHHLKLPSHIIVKFYEELIRYVKTNKPSQKQVDSVNKNFVYHTKFIENLKKHINKKIYEIYGDVFHIRVKEILTTYCRDYSCCQIVDFNKISSYLPDNIKEEIVDILIELDLSDNTMWLQKNELH